MEYLVEKLPELGRAEWTLSGQPALHGRENSWSHCCCLQPKTSHVFITLIFFFSGKWKQGKT